MQQTKKLFKTDRNDDLAEAMIKSIDLDISLNKIYNCSDLKAISLISRRLYSVPGLVMSVLGRRLTIKSFENLTKILIFGK